MNVDLRRIAVGRPMARWGFLWVIPLLAGFLANPGDTFGGPVFVSEPEVVVHSDPREEAPPVTTVEEGERLEVTETWYRVLLPSGRAGWVRASDVFLPEGGSKRVALLFTESGSARADEWGPVIAGRLAEGLWEQVEWLDRETFGQILKDQGLSIEAAEACPEDFVRLAEDVDGIMVCDCREAGEKARLDCRYVDMRVGGVIRSEFALGEAGEVEELADQMAEQLCASLGELLVLAAKESEEFAELEGEGQEKEPEPEAGLLDDMVLIPAGDFISLGSDGPERVIWLEAFYIDKFEVTNADYKAFDSEHTYPEGDDDHPASGVSWNQAIAYAEWRGKRLPTEEEWEKACRYTDGRLYPWGDTFEADRANINTTGTMPVARYETGKSPYGVYDLIGNVWEWTSSPPERGLRTRVLRGGAWSSSLPAEEAIFRYTAFPDDPDVSFGFRCAVSADAVPNEAR